MGTSAALEPTERGGVSRLVVLWRGIDPSPTTVQMSIATTTINMMEFLFVVSEIQSDFC